MGKIWDECFHLITHVLEGTGKQFENEGWWISGTWVQVTLDKRERFPLSLSLNENGI